MDREFVIQMGEVLVKRKKELLDRMQLSARSWSDLLERQIELEEQAANEALLEPFRGLDEQTVAELNRIEKALQKIKIQQYGICEQCGRQIHPKRLKAVPHTEKCLSCASKKAAGPEQEAENYEEPPENGTVPFALAGLEDDELAMQIKERLRLDPRIPTEELKVSCHDGVVGLNGYLPNRKSREIVLEIVSDTLGLSDFEDHLIVDPRHWKGRADSRKSGLPVDPADKRVPEKRKSDDRRS